MVLVLHIPFKTPTINHLYWHRGNVKIMKKEAKVLRDEIIRVCQLEPSEDLVNKKLNVYIEIYENWYTQKGDVKRKDIANREKFLIDSVFMGLELDDKFIFKHTSVKIQSETKEFAVVTIFPNLKLK